MQRIITASRRDPDTYAVVRTIYVDMDEDGAFYRRELEGDCNTENAPIGDLVDMTSILPAWDPKWTIFEEKSNYPDVARKPLEPGVEERHDRLRAINYVHALNTMEKVGDDHNYHLLRYYGCDVKNGKVVAMRAEKCEKSLATVISKDEEVDIDEVISSVRRGLEELESLGFAHSYLAPHHVYLSKHGWCVGGYEECRPMGSTFRYGSGIMGPQDYVFTSDTKEIHLARLRKHLLKEKFNTYQAAIIAHLETEFLAKQAQAQADACPLPSETNDPPVPSKL